MSRHIESRCEAALVPARAVLIGMVALASFLLFLPPTFGQTYIRLRFIDAESGIPLRGIEVSVNTWNSDESLIPADKMVSQSAFQKADKQGEVVFSVPEPPPKYLGVNHLTIELRGCSAGVFSLAEVLRSGVVADYNPRKRQWCGALNPRAAAKPGEIVIFDRRLTLWDRIRQELP